MTASMLFFFFGYTGNVKWVTLAAPVLTWGSPGITRAPAQLICKNLEREESRRGWFDCGQLWKWLCAMKLGQTMPDLNPCPLHSLCYLTGDISGPSIDKALLQYSRCKGGKQHNLVQRRNLPPSLPPATLDLLGGLHRGTAWKHMWCSCGAEKNTSVGRDRPLKRIVV